MTWWREAVFYQIYPRSFLDTDGDGVGDLEGIRRKIPYLVELGVDAIWISPIFPSPMKDFGYDVADYCGVDPAFGSLEQFDALLEESHRAGLRVILDWVPNHTSSEHPWFVDATSSRESIHRDWYVWREPSASGAVPNNWLRAWSAEPAWTLDDRTGQFYLHCFLPDQPDLNWANVQVRSAMAETLRFWLDRGVDGFRMDVVHLIGKDRDLVDDPVDLAPLGHVPLNDVPETHEYLREIRQLLEQYNGDRVSVGEVYLLDPARVVDYYGDGDELHLSFNFASMFTPWRADAWRALIEQTESTHQVRSAWPTWVLSNHDNQRIASRLKGYPQRVRSAAILLFTLRGSPFLYAGEELGLLDAEIPLDRQVDPGGRDGCRAPVPWTTGERHGWAGEPWLPFAAAADENSVETQVSHSDSMLNFTRSMLSLRRSRKALRTGALTNLRVIDDVLSYERVNGDERVVVYVNFAKEKRAVKVSSTGVVLISGSGSVSQIDGCVTLEAGEGALLVP